MLVCHGIILWYQFYFNNNRPVVDVCLFIFPTKFIGKKTLLLFACREVHMFMYKPNATKNRVSVFFL